MSALLKKLKITLALVACSASFAVMAQDKILVGVDTAFVPFEFKQGNKYVGFDIDLWQAIAKKMNVSYELRPMDFSGLIPGLQSRNRFGPSPFLICLVRADAYSRGHTTKNKMSCSVKYGFQDSAC